jgi:hypothetical protein
MIFPDVGIATLQLLDGIEQADEFKHFRLRTYAAQMGLDKVDDHLRHGAEHVTLAFPPLSLVDHDSGPNTGARIGRFIRPGARATVSDSYAAGVTNI